MRPPRSLSPDTNGFHWLKRLRDHHLEHPPAVVLFTADAELADRRTDLAALGAMFASTRCDATEIERLIASLVMMRSTLEPLGSQPRAHTTAL